jgi:anti-sigma factor RsiW
MTNSEMTCEAFDAALSDYLEGTLDGPMRAQVEQHLRECVRCASLVRDLENIQKEAAALPDLVPSRDLWTEIESRIAAPIIPLVARPEKQRRIAPVWMGIAAAALIVSTAGVTYVLTARSLGSRVAAVATNQPTQTQAAGTTSIASAGSSGTDVTGSPDNATARSSGGSNLVQSQSTRRRPVPSASVVAVNLQTESAQSERLYGKEIAMLQTIVGQRKTVLDSSTVAIIERNLRIIDAAIDQSRAALARDPASALLSQQLTHALDKKVELLRTAAMLPAST